MNIKVLFTIIAICLSKISLAQDSLFSRKDTLKTSLAFQDKYIKDHIIGTWKDQNSTLIFRKNKSYSVLYDSTYFADGILHIISNPIRDKGKWQINNAQLVFISTSLPGVEQFYQILYFSPTKIKYQLIFPETGDKTIWVAEKIE
jgi:hypothetical protein